MSDHCGARSAQFWGFDITCVKPRLHAGQHKDRKGREWFNLSEFNREADAEAVADLPKENDRLRREVEYLNGKMRALRAIHAPVEVPQLGKCCKANHGVAWKRWPCGEAEILGMEGSPL